MTYTRFLSIVTVILCCALSGVVQNCSDDVQFVSGDENTVTLTASAVASKKKDAETLAAQSAFNCLMHTGVAGLKDGPASGEYFKDALDEWLRANAFHGIYDMSRSTDKYISVSINVPLWNAAKNRTYTLSNFGSDLRKFFKKHLGEDYKANVTAMGQSMTVIIE